MIRWCLNCKFSLRLKYYGMLWWQVCDTREQGFVGLPAGSDGEWNSCCEVKHPSGKQVSLLATSLLLRCNGTWWLLCSARFQPLRSVMCCICLVCNFTPSPHCTSHIILISSPSRSLSVRSVICFGAHFGRWHSLSVFNCDFFAILSWLKFPRGYEIWIFSIINWTLGTLMGN